MADVKAQQLTKAEDLVASAQFRHLVQGFEKACGLKLHAYTAGAVSVDVPFQAPPFCQELQAGTDCPLYFNPDYHTADGPELRPTCAGLGHAVIPVQAPDGTPLLSLVSETVRFGPIDMEQITEKAFRLKVFPDTLAGGGAPGPLLRRGPALLPAPVALAGGARARVGLS